MFEVARAMVEQRKWLDDLADQLTFINPEAKQVYDTTLADMMGRRTPTLMAKAKVNPLLGKAITK